jgi:pyridoxal phosphate enzyme (YggS family)
MEPPVSSIAENLAALRRRMESACARSGRSLESVRLLAVSKLHPTSSIRECYTAGQRDFGENYAQQLRDKALQLSDLAEIRWHAIGPLQINKTKYVAALAREFHALDRLEVARALSARRKGEPLRCYIEVNLALEASKSGLAAGAVPEFLRSLRGFGGLEAVGLMCLPPPGPNPDASRPYFRRLRQMADELRLTELSMGTTLDFEVAIEEGSTVVRVGTAIFGERPGG